jgi:ubiquinone/menaquinone biosynthesis C-methylase UbiE
MRMEPARHLKMEAQRVQGVVQGPNCAGPGLSANDFRKIASKGLGDPYNCYPHAMTWFADHLYVGTSRANLHYRGRWRAEQGGVGLGKMWPVKIPEGSLFDIDLRAQIWRYHPPTNRWERVLVSPFARGIDGFDVPLSIGFRAMTSFQGRSDSAPALYVPTWGSHQTPESVMMRSEDGVNFEIVSKPGLGFPDPYQPRAIRGLVSFKGRLFAAPAAGRKRAEPNTSGFMVIFVTSDPARGDWKLACEPHFGDPKNLTAFDLAEFNGYLYAGTANLEEGFQIWKTDGEGEPPYKWTRVLTRGAYRGNLNQGAARMVPFGEHLYVGTAIQEGGWDVNNNIGPAAPEIIRINPDDSWDLIVGEPRSTPDGLKLPLSGLGPGFGNLFSGYLWSLRGHRGWLYAGDSDWSFFLKFASTERIPERVKSVLTEANIERTIRGLGGCALWRSRNGYEWVPVTQNGFNNCYNMGIRNMVSTSYGLFLGIANPYAPEVALERVAGWNYEDNPMGGMEVWLGSHSHSPALLLSSSGEKSTHQSARHLVYSSTAENTGETIKDIVAQFFEGSDFRLMGYWREGVTDAMTAGQRLMDEILSFAQEKNGTIIDIDCGLGATTQMLSKWFPRDSITGITARKGDLETCRKTAPDLTFLQRKVPKLNLPAASFDFAIRLRSLGGAGLSKRLLREISRVLRPGGQFLCFDVLESATAGQWENFWHHELRVKTMEDFEGLLHMLGFQEIRIVDVTPECLGGFRKYMRTYFGMRRLRGEIDEDTSQKVEQHLLESIASIERCFIVSCRKSEDG